MKPLLRFFPLLLGLSVWMSACSPTKYLTEDEYLLTANKVVISNENDLIKYDFSESDLLYLLRPVPNSKLFFMRFGTRIYNMRSDKSLERAKKKYERKKENLIEDKKKLEDKTDKYRNNYRKYKAHLEDIEELDIKIRVLTKWLNTKTSVTNQDLVINSAQNYKKTYKAQCKKELKTNEYDARLKDLKEERDKFEKGSSDFKKIDKKLKKFQFKRDEAEAKDCNKLHWTRKAGEEPVKFKQNDIFRNERQINIFLKNKGYYTRKVRTKTEPAGRKKREVIYTVYPNEPYKIRSFVPESTDTLFVKKNPTLVKNTLLKKDALLDVSLLESERQRIYDNLRNIGYYKFSKDYIFYSIDTLGGNHSANIRMIIKQPIENNKLTTHKAFKIRNVNIYPDYDPKAALSDTENYTASMDTFVLGTEKGNTFRFLSNTPEELKPATIVKGIYIFSDSLYQSSDVKATYKYLSAMKIIKIANIDFEEIPANVCPDTIFGYLDCNIKLSQNERQSFTSELEATNTSGDIGAAGNIIYAHKNIFKNAELLDIRIKGALERKVNTDGTTSTDEANSDLPFFNSYEIGADVSLEFPRLFVPGDLTKFIKKNNPKTVFNTNINILARPDYKRQVAGLSFGYFWNTSPEVRHTFRPVLFDLVQLRNPSEDFLSYINRYKLYESYEDHLILGSAYTIAYQGNSKSNNRNQIYLRINGKIAGNSLYGAMALTGQPKTDGNYRIGENSFAQFTKLDVDFRYYRKTGKNNKLVFRSFLGAVYPYGNLKVVPFGEKYFTGGANGIRAWQVRTLGPGSYYLPVYIDVFPNQTADIKAEFNLEYRQKIFWMLEGAVFVDAGNIWAINEADDRTGAQFKFNNFYNEIAVGTGVGFRFDFDFFILRLDIGLKLRDPAAPPERRWVHLQRAMKYDDWAFNIGIGYPF